MTKFNKVIKGISLFIQLGNLVSVPISSVMAIAEFSAGNTNKGYFNIFLALFNLFAFLHPIVPNTVPKEETEE